MQPELYELAIKAVKDGSETALVMLTRLPDMDCDMKGWIFEYAFEDLLRSEPMISRRWVFKEARKIDNPVSLEDKMAHLKAEIAT